MNHRVIARLDIKGPNLVKGIHLEGLRVLGDPADFASFYAKHGADEILYMDVVASLYERNSIHELISETARNAFIPITVGGGLRTIDDIKNVLRAGADKVSINTAATRNPGFITEASKCFGSSTIAISIEAIKHTDGYYYAYIDNGREATGREVLAWAVEAVNRGAGEVIITSVDQEGTGNGFDLNLTQCLANAVDVPVVACGGAGCPEDVEDVIIIAGADAVALASIIHYDLISNAINDNKKQCAEGNTEFLGSNRVFKKIQPASIDIIKKHMQGIGIGVRL